MEQLAVDTRRASFRCLVADDSLFARKHIAKIVSRIGVNVIGEAVNGREAVEQYFRLRPDLVLLDITMPELDGVEALQKILEGDGNAKVVMVSSIGHREMVNKAISLGARHFITKPYEPDYVTMIVRSLIDAEGSGDSCGTNI